MPRVAIAPSMVWMWGVLCGLLYSNIGIAQIISDHSRRLPLPPASRGHHCTQWTGARRWASDENHTVSSRLQICDENDYSSVVMVTGDLQVGWCERHLDGVWSEQHTVLTANDTEIIARQLPIGTHCTAVAQTTLHLETPEKITGVFLSTDGRTALGQYTLDRQTGNSVPTTEQDNHSQPSIVGRTSIANCHCTACQQQAQRRSIAAIFTTLFLGVFLPRRRT